METKLILKENIKSYKNTMKQIFFGLICITIGMAIATVLFI